MASAERGGAVKCAGIAVWNVVMRASLSRCHWSKGLKCLRE